MIRPRWAAAGAADIADSHSLSVEISFPADNISSASPL